MGVKKEERETIIVFNEADNEASVYTFNTHLKKRLAEFARRFPQLADDIVHRIDTSHLAR